MSLLASVEISAETERRVNAVHGSHQTVSALSNTDLARSPWMM